MHRNKLACSLLVLVVAGSMWACSDDDTDPTGTAGSGGASAGSSGKGGSGGAKAGTGGKAGEDTGSAGEGGAEAVAGAGAGGDSAGGAGGAGGDSSEGGIGGEGGAAPMATLAENCATVCAAQAALTCTGDCVDNCVLFGAPPDGTTEPALYAAMIACQAELLTANDYECSSGNAGPINAITKEASQCEPKVCAWICADLSGLGDQDVYDRCGCT